MSAPRVVVGDAFLKIEGDRAVALELLEQEAGTDVFQRLFEFLGHRLGENMVGNLEHCGDGEDELVFLDLDPGGVALLRAVESIVRMAERSRTRGCL